ncbi:het-E-1 heterokaryon incompatibility protein [Fusarium phyllophilum]|uniref:Het-E-1 heterokaryon incompatibility protein n=1 Tax=Fusarium phyllophilum TaxID=47803 RepID=A0A8H5NKL7_9HYPO|nr:het-E-1 heterokaryon incompatibility protein [Fusarium phyllophilum]
MPNSFCLWTKARENLPVDVKEWLASLERGIQPNATATEQIDALIEQTTKKQKELEKSNHRFRKYFDKIIHWLDRVKGIGDVISSFDPVHAALPWATFRFVLQAILAEREQAESVLELLASTPHFVFSGRVLEMVYTRESMHIGEAHDAIKLSQQCLDNLHEELIKFYSLLFGALQYCYSISNKHKVKRKATAIFNSSEVVSIYKDLEVQHKKVIACGENCHKILNHTLSSKSLDLLQKIQPTLTELGDRVQELLVRIDESERREMLGAISSILFRAHHDEVSRKRTAGTCDWILNRETFIQWEQSDSSVTILYGSPGAGKTFLISRVIDSTIERAKTGEAVAFFYCKRDEENRRNPRDILRSILRQLSTPVKEVESGTIHIALPGLPSRLELNGTTFDVATCESLIGRLADDYPRTTIILDALDECDRNTREELMRVLSNLTSGSTKLRVFISSRHDEDIRRHFKGSPIMEVQATDNEEDISSFVGDRLFLDSRWGDLSLELQEEVKAVFHEKSHGMFQWAALQVDQIRRLKIWSERSIKGQLETSPIGLKGAYDVVWNQIQEMSAYEEQLAKRAFRWVLCAFRPLETSDLLLMIQIDLDSGIIEADTAFTPETIQSICGNLLVYDRQSKVWRFSHLSAREYIEKHHYSMLECHHHVAISSMRFLERDLLWLLPEKSLCIRSGFRIIEFGQPDLNGRCVEYTATCGYIVKHVLWHAHELDSPMFRSTKLPTLLRNFFEPISQGNSCFQAWSRLSANVNRDMFAILNSPLFSRGTRLVPSTPLQAMSTHGLFHMLRGLWEEAGGELDVFPTSTPSPLTLAIRNRHEPIWKFILLANANLNNGTPGPLTTAIECDNVEAFEALLEAKADVNSGYSIPFPILQPFPKSHHMARPATPLTTALWYSRKESRRYFIQSLLDGRVDVNLKTQGRTILELAIQYADEEAVRMLLEANTEVYNPNHLLSLAAQNQKCNLVPLLVNLGANIKEPWEGILPLVRALEGTNLPFVQSLMEMTGTSIDLSFKDHREGILSALRNPYGVFSFHLLFGFNPHINWLDCDTSTLERALRSYPKYEYELYGLGFDGSNFALQCFEGTAQRQLSLVDTLRNAGPDPSVSVRFGSGNTLTGIAFHARLHHVRALLDQETTDIEQAQRALFRTSLFFMMSGHLGIVSRIHPCNQWKPLGNECLCPKYLEVLQCLFDGYLSVYMPMYDFLDPLIPLVYINGEGYEINRLCRLYVKGSLGDFSQLWFSIMWDFQNSTSPQLPLGSQLRQWQFPGILPPRCFIVTKVTALSRAQPTYFIIISIVGNRSQFNIVSAPQRVREPLSQRSEDGRWKRYKPESFGVTRFTDPDGRIESGSTKATAVRGKFEANASSCYRNMFASVLLAFVVVLLFFFMALEQCTQRT